METVEGLIAEARSDEPTDWQALAWHLADALEAAIEGRDALAATLERVRGVAEESMAATGEPDGTAEWAVGVNYARSQILGLLDSAPSVARALPDRDEAFRRFVDSFNGDEAGEIDLVWSVLGDTGWAMRGGNDVRAVFDKVLAAIETAPVVSDDTEWESQCKAPGEEWRDCVAPGCGNPRRKRVPAGPWVAIEKGGE